MPNHSNVVIVGHLGHDPAVRQVGDKNVANFSVAVTKKSKGGDNTTWYNVAAWGRLSDVAQNYLKKGSAVMISGGLQMETYKKNDGGEGVKLAVDARDLVLLGAKSQGETTADTTEYNGESLAPVAKAMQQAQAAAATAPGPAVAATGDVPF